MAANPSKSPFKMSVFDYSDGMIFVGSFYQGYQDSADINFLAALVLGLGINVQFEETRLSMTRIIITSVGGYFLGKYLNANKKSQQ